MARGVNKVILIGNLGKDPEVRYMPSGTAVATATLATTESWTDKESKEKQERTEWHNLEFFGRLAEVVGEYCKKGAKIYVEGKLRTDKWQDKEGRDRYTTKIRVDEMQMLDGRGQGGGSSAEYSGGAPRTGSSEERPAAKSGASANNKPAAGAGFDEFDDDIPF